MPHSKTTKNPINNIVGSYELFDGKKVERYLAIPYAHPPIGNLRFRKPVPLIRPFLEPIVANKWPNACQQPPTHVIDLGFQNSKLSEDCLYLNVWARPYTNTLKPVMVYIHGGAFKTWSSSEILLDGLAFVAIGDVVLVTINYRLGAFAYLNGGTPDMPGNLAIHDQIMALEWINSNIAVFSGDPRRITVFGHSSGSSSVGVLLLSPLTKKLFRNAIMMSDSPLKRTKLTILGSK